MGFRQPVFCSGQSQQIRKAAPGAKRPFLPLTDRSTYLERLGKLRSRGRNVGGVVEEEFNSLWYDAAEEQQGE
jgi:hypothetical protein